MEYVGSIRQAWEFQCVHGGSLVAMHEHINHFSLEVMDALLSAADLRAISLSETPLRFIVAVATADDAVAAFARDELSEQEHRLLAP